MKLTITLGLLVLAIGAQAQQSTTSTKKAKAATNTATINNATATTPAAAPAAGASTATLPAAAPTKKWGVTFLNDASMSHNDTKSFDKKPIETVNYLGASYKVTDKVKLGVRQYFKYNIDPNETTDIKQDFTVLTAGTKVGGILGSDDISPSLLYYVPNTTAEENGFGKNIKDFQGIVRLDAEPTWTLNPKWSVSMYTSLRETLGSDEFIKFDQEANAAKFFAASTRLITQANLYYNINDAVQTYVNAGVDQRYWNSRSKINSVDYISATGASVTMFGGKLTINGEVGVTSSVKKYEKPVAGAKLYSAENLGYTLATVIAL